MLSILRQGYSLCDRVPRRRFLEVGGSALCGVSLPQLLRAETSIGRGGGRRDSHKAAIIVFLPGGPSHLDLFDLKPEAPVEVRGEFRPIPTSVPGIDICEHLPRLAATMHHFALIRSIVGAVDDHACHMCLTGAPRLGPAPSGGRPSIGSVVSRLLGPADPSVPPAINLSRRMIHPPYNDPGPGFLGVGHAAFRPDGPSLENLTLGGIGPSRFQERRQLLDGVDQLRRDVDATGTLNGLDLFTQRAFELVTSPRLRDAMDLSDEDAQVAARYGPNNPELIEGFNAAPRMTDDLLTARRLIEAGARCVTVSFGAWDWHTDNFAGHLSQMPYLDRGLAALVDDLHARGLDQDVLVVAWGEFGRSPRINQTAGRDHWPGVSCALLAGGGLRTGQVIGSTNRLGESAKTRPVSMQDVLATIYNHLQINVSNATLPDFSGRPQYLLESGVPIQELDS
ncbi:MAG: DUF1501 domain-containing protein [Planctomycetaceae bacterium]